MLIFFFFVSFIDFISSQMCGSHISGGYCQHKYSFHSIEDICHCLLIAIFFILEVPVFDELKLIL